MAEEILNRVTGSGIITIDLADHFARWEIVELDLKDWLFHGLILKEKDFREKLETHDWSKYANKCVAITLSAEAVVPLWAYMLLAARLRPYASDVVAGTQETILAIQFRNTLSALDIEEYRDKRVVIKGCGDMPVPASAYVEITRILQPVAKSIMFGEPCSTVPVYKQPKK
ncbi:MAG: DUF2480 family protein [Bacteroidota bacterium]|nr:DUF2480 family protein [Bacteroidota bacterium]